MITLFCNEEQKKEEGVFWKFFGFTFFSLFSLFWQKVCFRASLVFAGAPALFMHFFSFSLFILFGNHLIRIIPLYFLSSLVFIHYTLYINTHTRTL